MIAIMLIAISNIKAQDQIEGRVLELSENGNILPVFGANVYWEGTNLGTVTDIKGNYSIGIPSATTELKVSYVGYTFEREEIVDNKQIFYLKNSVGLDEVQVKGNVNTTKISIIDPINIQTISTEEIQKAACCNLSECFETNNTVDVSYSDGVSGIKKIQMLGLDGKYIQITSELIPLIRGAQRSYGLSYIPGSWIESIQIIKGAGSVVNGYESFTGQINVEYFQPDEDSGDKLNWNVYTNYSGKLENNLILTKQKGDWKSNLFTHVSYFNKEIDNHGYNNGGVQAGDGFLDMPKFKQLSLLNRWKYYGSEKYKFQINLRTVIEERDAGQITKDESIINPYLINIDNQLFQVYTKFGKIKSDAKSIGSQTSFTLHNKQANFGNKTYTVTQESFSFNIIEQNQLNVEHLLKYGGSYFADRFTENFEGRANIIHVSLENKGNPGVSYANKRVDLVTGLFAEHQYENEQINIITGLRADYYNIEDKIYYSPRLNVKYNSDDNTAIRFSAGKAFRISNVLSENMNFLASSRSIIIEDNLKPEIGWNYGFNISYCFYFLNNEATLNFDVYRTEFQNQIIVNIENPNELLFANLTGKSFSNVIQIDLDYSITDNVQMRLGYKKNKAISTFNGIEKQLPLQPEERGLINFSYKTNSDKWHIDITANYIGRSRLPEHDNFSSPFTLFNSQITRNWDNFSLYIGGENLTNFTQPNPIVDAENPFGNNFDASLIWGPVMGSNIYAGFRYNIP